MNILNTAHSKALASKKTQTGLADVLGGSAKDPKAIAALKANPKYKNINFDHVLNAAEKGHDPKAMADLLVKEKASASQVESKLMPNQLNKEAPAKELKLTSSAKKPIANNIQNMVKPKTDNINSIIGQKPQAIKAQMHQPEVAKPEVGQTGHKSIFPKQINMASQVAKTQGTPIQSMNQMAAKTEAPVEKKSIFTTPRVLDIQKSSKYAKPATNSSLNNINQAAIMGSPVVMNANAKVAVANPRMQSNDLVSLQEMKVRKSAGGYKSSSQSMIKNQSSEINPMMAPKVAGNNEKSENKSEAMDLGSQMEMNSQRFSQNGLNPQQMNQNSNLSQAGKVFNMSQMQNAGDTEKVIGQIQDYVVQAQANNQSEVSMSFEHKELGQVDLLVQKLDPKAEQLNIQIATRGAEAAEFFKAHQSELLGNLNRAGIQVADFKLESAASSNNSQQDFSQDNMNKGDQQFADRGQRQSEQGQRDADQQRREKLWNQFYGNKEAA